MITFIGNTFFTNIMKVFQNLGTLDNDLSLITGMGLELLKTVFNATIDRKRKQNGSISAAALITILQKENGSCIVLRLN